MRWYSSIARPCARMISSVCTIPLAPQKRLEDAPAVVAAEDSLRGSLRMRHQAEHVARGIDDSRDLRPGAIRIFRVAEDDLPLALEPSQAFVVDEVPSVVVGDRQANPLALLERTGKRRPVVFDDQVQMPADELARRVLQQRARQQAGLGENLEAVADAEHLAAAAREANDLVHHRGEAPDRSTSQIISEGEAAGEDDDVGSA